MVDREDVAPGTVAVGVIHCGINGIKDASAHAYGPREIAENVILCGSKLKERYPSISIIIMWILHAAETFRDRNSRIVQVNALLKQSCFAQPMDSCLLSRQAAGET